MSTVLVYIPSPTNAVIPVQTELAEAMVRTQAGTRLDRITPWQFSNVTGDVVGGGVIDLVASTPVELDLTSTGWSGAGSFSAVTAMMIRNEGDDDVLIGDATTNSFQGPLSAGSTYRLSPGETLAFKTSDTGYTTTSANKLKIDPESTTAKVTVAIKGF